MTPASRRAAGMLVIGTRGSELAAVQTAEVLDRLRVLHPELRTVVRTITTSGDRDRTAPLSVIGGKGVFAKELELALLDGEIDVAVHSLKDLPPVLATGLVLAAVPPRADARDALVSRDRQILAQLPAGSRVGTSSARRRALLLRARPDLRIAEVRGNVGTRVRKVQTGQLDAVMLAAAGLSRLGLLGEAAEVFSIDRMPPPPGQGALALQVRADDEATLRLAVDLDDAASRAAATAERAFLAQLGAGCTLPVAAYADVHGDTIDLRGMIAAPDGSRAVERRAQGRVDAAEALGALLADELMAAGGADFLKTI